MFYPHQDSADYTLAYRIWDGSVWSDGQYVRIKQSDGTFEYEKSEAEVTPVAAGDILYVFFTGLGGRLDYVTYDPEIANEDDRWKGYWRVPNGILNDVTGRYAATYNFTNNSIEVYWTPDRNVVYMNTLDLNTGAWGQTKTVAIPKDPNHPTIACYLSAVFNQLGENDYVTYLSWADGSAGYLAELKDGVVLRHLSSLYWQPEATNRAPSLADLSEDFLAIVWNLDGEYSWYQKYDKKQHTATEWPYAFIVPFKSQEHTSWVPNGVVFSEKVVDDSSPTGYRMDCNFYVFVENNPIFAKRQWEMVSCEYLGYWMPTGQANSVDYGELTTDTFNDWPILGIVDMPPYVLNGNPQCLDCTACSCTTAELSFSQANTTGMSGQLSLGAYVETGSKSPLTLDISAGYTGGFETSKTYTFVQGSSINSNLDGRIMAFYLAPIFDVYQLEWHDLNGAATGIFTRSVEVVGAQVRKESFKPQYGPFVSESGPPPDPPYLNPAVFLMHASLNDRDRLDTYWLDPINNPYNYESITGDAANSMIASWDVNSPGYFGWKIDETHSIDNGFNVKFKVGANLGKAGFGAEGSFEMHFKTQTQTGVQSFTFLRNLAPVDPLDPERVTGFTVYGYWLKPSDSAYWIPTNRQGMGDTPWFITYRVENVEPF